jgi:hypothetical protein
VIESVPTEKPLVVDTATPVAVPVPFTSVAVPAVFEPTRNVTVPVGVPVPVESTTAESVTVPFSCSAVGETLAVVVVATGATVTVTSLDVDVG